MKILGESRDCKSVGGKKKRKTPCFSASRPMFLCVALRLKSGCSYSANGGLGVRTPHVLSLEKGDKMLALISSFYCALL